MGTIIFLLEMRGFQLPKKWKNIRLFYKTLGVYIMSDQYQTRSTPINCSTPYYNPHSLMRRPLNAAVDVEPLVVTQDVNPTQDINASQLF